MKAQKFFSLIILAAATCVSSAVSAGWDFLKVVTEAAQEAGVIDESTKNQLNTTTSAVAKATETITPEQQYYIGRAVAGTVLASYPLYTNKKATAYVNKVCAAITACSDMPYLYKGYFVGILDSPEINAISTPGGHILVTRGLLECAKTEDALAAVIAHEIAHIQLQHAVKAIKSSRTTNALVETADTALTASGKSASTAEFSGCVDDIVNQVVNSGYSKKQEFEADKKALVLMNDAGYDPKAMQDMLNILKAKESTQDKNRGFCKTHPNAASRLNNISEDEKKYTGDYKCAERATRFAAVQNSL